MMRNPYVFAMVITVFIAACWCVFFGRQPFGEWSTDLCCGIIFGGVIALTVHSAISRDNQQQDQN